MKVGDLVKCPAFDGHAAYAGIILGVYGHKVEVLGGTHKSWGGEGKMTWDICVIHLIKESVNETR